MAGRVWMNGSANAARITGDLWSRVQAKKHGDGVKNRRGGAPGGARAGHTARGCLRKGAQLLPAPFRRSAPSRGEGREMRAVPAPTKQQGR